jgi:hypothetical protein
MVANSQSIDHMSNHNNISVNYVLYVEPDKMWEGVYVQLVVLLCVIESGGKKWENAKSIAQWPEPSSKGKDNGGHVGWKKAKPKCS